MASLKQYLKITITSNFNQESYDDSSIFGTPNPDNLSTTNYVNNTYSDCGLGSTLYGGNSDDNLFINMYYPSCDTSNIRNYVYLAGNKGFDRYYINNQLVVVESQPQVYIYDSDHKGSIIRTITNSGGAYNVTISGPVIGDILQTDAATYHVTFKTESDNSTTLILSTTG